MGKQHEIFGSDIYVERFNAEQTITMLDKFVSDAKSEGWADLYFVHDEHCINLMGVKPPNEAEIEKAKERRRKQYERLKKEFER